MKKIFTLFLACLITCSFSEVFAQAKQYILFDHFTNTSCAPCAAQNPFMEATFAVNFGRYHQISYHTWWPGPTDPMYTFNKKDNHKRTIYYGVNGVPDIFMLGSTNLGSPTAVTQQLINNAAYVASPLRIRVREVSSGLTRTATIKVYTVGTVPPSSNYKIFGCVNEEHIHYNTAPGSNGEKDFYNVMRKLLPDSLGADFTPAPLGDSVTVTYSFTLDYAHWDTTQIYTLAFVQNNISKLIINSGSSIDPDWELVPIDPAFKKGAPGTLKSFHYKVFNLGGNAQNFRFKMDAGQPSDWDAEYVLNGTAHADSVDVSIPGKAVWDLVVNINIGTTPFLGTHTLSMQSLDQTEFAPNALTAYLISGINELVINNDAGWGDGSGLTPVSFQHNYLSGLAFAGASAYAVTDLTTFKRGYTESCLSDVQNYYYNVGWSFPALTDDFVAMMTSELNAGKRMLISGQDIGWDVYTASSSGGHTTAATKSFYNNYLGAIFSNDGGTTNNQYIANSSDTVFGGIPTASLVNVYGGSNFFPDEITKTGPGMEIFYYNTTKTKKGGVRAYGANWKTVYLAASLEQISDTMIQKAIIKQAHIWFGGIPTGIQTTNAGNREYLGQNYPNPASGTTTILLNNIDTEMNLQIIDPLGRIVRNETVSEGSAYIVIPVSSLNAGVYFYRLISNGRVLETKRMQVVR
ncbi:MAG: T9SS type A sorting domain-containing protein [Bacteroidetes bacterium]|nr:T9SS type A sorting domain-containing protein [Bacteroidota bacterium]